MAPSPRDCPWFAPLLSHDRPAESGRHRKRWVEKVKLRVMGYGECPPIERIPGSGTLLMEGLYLPGELTGAPPLKAWEAGSGIPRVSGIPDIRIPDMPL